jgi:MerR family transcriptional regulator, heat shock protein HspR
MTCCAGRSNELAAAPSREAETMSSPFEISDDTPVYVISVAAELAGLHPQTLRAYDRLGLVSPGRAAGRGRRYSLRDILALREVQRLSQEEGVNLSGIKRILELESELERSGRMLAELTAQFAQLRAELESTRAVAARLAGLVRRQGGGAELVPVREARSAPPQAGGSPPGSSAHSPAAMLRPPPGPMAGSAPEPGSGASNPNQPTTGTQESS